MTRRSILALATFTFIAQSRANTPPVSRIETTASAAMERKLDHQLNKHIAFPLNGGERMEGAAITGYAKGGIALEGSAMDALDAARRGVGAVHIVDGREPHILLQSLLSDAAVGTAIRA